MKFTNSDSAQIDLTMEVPYLTFPAISKLSYIKHGFSTRLGGVSGGMFSSMNFGSESIPYQDEPANILENYKRMAKSMDLDVSSMVLSKQVHKTNIRLVTEEDMGKGILFPGDFEEIDGLITNRPGITLVTKYADCVPLYFVDTKKKAIGLTHSGWRGTVLKIGRITVEEMGKAFGSDPKDIIAVVGPSICKACFEIGEEVAAEFEKAFPQEKAHILTQEENGKHHCDLWAANRFVLLEAGLLPENIQISKVCTCCNDDLLFSHRKSGGKRGSLAAFLTITA